MELYQGIILGIVQGLTEFLPVSSSGHLVLGQIFFGMTQSQLAFDISVHMGTLLAVVVVYASDILAIILSLFRFAGKIFLLKPPVNLISQDQNLQMAGLIAVGSIPTAVLGLVLKQFEHILFTSQLLVGIMLILTGTILWLSRRYYFNEHKVSGSGIQLAGKALFVGFCQGCAVVPGISRSGVTIAAGMVMGFDRDRAARFSFLLSIPAILGAQVLSIKDMMGKGLVIDNVTISATVIAFITGLIALKLLLKLVHSGRFHLFAPYCWVIGALVILSKLI